LATHLLVLLLAAALGACSGNPEMRLPNPKLLADPTTLADIAQEAPWQSRNSRHPSPLRVFISGHSLVNLPFPPQLAAIAANAGQPVEWKHQNLLGSSISQRNPPFMPDGPYDALIITERHDLLATLMFNDTAGNLRLWQKALVETNSNALTYFFVPWLQIGDRDKPRDWIAYERAAALVWQCVVTRINAESAANGSSSRIITVPANLALAELVDRIQSGAELPGISARDARATLDRVFADNVHLTPLGSFHVALVSYLGLSGMEPGDLEPHFDALDIEGVSPQQARTLLAEVDRFLRQRHSQRLALAPESCRQYLQASFIDDYWAYARKANLAPQQGWLRSHWSAWRMKQQSERFFSSW
jgi:hypothetical protein